MLRLAGFEGTQLYGDTLLLDANRGTGQEKIGFTLRQPCGVVAAVPPFNYPSLFVLHQVAPASAAGNLVVVRPTRATPWPALALACVLLDAGLPDGALSVVTGSGGELGDALVAGPRVRKISFTGSPVVTDHIAEVAGVKRLLLELGASCPVIVLPDADLDAAADAIAAVGYIGQVCISVQRVITHPSVHADFLDALAPKVEAISVGDPSRDDTRMGTLISTGAAQGVETAIRDAVADGARLLTGGKSEGAQVAPAAVVDVDPDAPMKQQELFRPPPSPCRRRATGSRQSGRRTRPAMAWGPAYSPRHRWRDAPDRRRRHPDRSLRDDGREDRHPPWSTVVSPLPIRQTAKLRRTR